MDRFRAAWLIVLLALSAVRASAREKWFYDAIYGALAVLLVCLPLDRALWLRGLREGPLAILAAERLRV